MQWSVNVCKYAQFPICNGNQGKNNIYKEVEPFYCLPNHHYISDPFNENLLLT